MKFQHPVQPKTSSFPVASLASLAFFLLGLSSVAQSGAFAEEAQAGLFKAESIKLVEEAYELFESGEADLALEGFAKALALDSGSVTARLGQAMVFQEQQRHQDAFAAYDFVVQKDPGHAFAWNGRGLAAFNLENFDEAINSFKQATSDQPINGYFYESMAWTHLCRAEYAEAADSAKQATLMYGKNGEFSLYPLLIAYFAQIELGNPNGAERTLRYALANKPADDAWPSPVFDFLSGSIDQAQLVSFVTDRAQETEAQTYIGLQKRSRGDFDAAEPHLDWAANKGDRRLFEHRLARTLQSPKKVARLEP